jgi:multidrug efflux pump subunit AcrA (membrane-fusion protein)
MDIQKPDNSRARKIKRGIYAGVVLLSVGGTSIAVSRLRPAGPTVDRSTIWTGEVKRGAMLRDVHGVGTLVPEEIRWIPAQTDSRADRIVQRPGALVKPDSIILELSNPSLQRDTLDAEYQAHADQQRALYDLRKGELDALHVRAGIGGVLQLVPVEVGQHVVPGTNLARVADPKRLKAEIKIAETQAKDIAIGQKASIDTRNAIVTGSVSRIDPSVQNGTVTVDVELPGGARPDLTVDGTIELENLRDILFVGRPAHGQPETAVGLFKMVGDGSEAVHVNVKLGRASVNSVEVLQGLGAGDVVILSDMSNWDSYERIRLR